MNRKEKGFTIVELLIVVVIIGILAAIVIVAYNGVTARANDSHRVSDVDTVKKFLEIFYVQNGYYPGSSNIINANAATALSTGPLKGLSPDALKGPGASASTVSSWGQWAGNVTTAGMNYAYKSFFSDGTDCLDVADRCTRYEIYYKLEAGDANYKLIYSANR